MKVKMDVDKKRVFGREFTAVKCEKCGVFYEPYGKEHKCKAVKSGGNDHEQNYQGNT